MYWNFESSETIANIMAICLILSLLAIYMCQYGVNMGMADFIQAMYIYIYIYFWPSALYGMIILNILLLKLVKYFKSTTAKTVVLNRWNIYYWDVTDSFLISALYITSFYQLIKLQCTGKKWYFMRISRILTIIIS